jgi:hypothetical protein
LQLKQLVVDESDLLQAPVLQIGQRLRHLGILRELVDRNVHFRLRIFAGLFGDIALHGLAIHGLPFHDKVPSKSIPKSTTTGGFSGGGSCVGSGLSIFTACVTGGSEMMKMMSNTNITSINGVMLMSVKDPAEPPSFMAIARPPLSRIGADRSI